MRTATGARGPLRASARDRARRAMLDARPARLRRTSVVRRSGACELTARRAKRRLELARSLRRSSATPTLAICRARRRSTGRPVRTPREKLLGAGRAPRRSRAPGLASRRPPASQHAAHRRRQPALRAAARRRRLVDAVETATRRAGAGADGRAARHRHRLASASSPAFAAASCSWTASDVGRRRLRARRLAARASRTSSYALFRGRAPVSGNGITQIVDLRRRPDGARVPARRLHGAGLHRHAPPPALAGGARARLLPARRDQRGREQTGRATRRRRSSSWASSPCCSTCCCGCRTTCR